MKIKVLKNCAGRGFSLTQGQIIDLPESITKPLINAKYAEEIKQIENKVKTPPEKAVKKGGGKK